MKRVLVVPWSSAAKSCRGRPGIALFMEVALWWLISMRADVSRTLQILSNPARRQEEVCWVQATENNLVIDLKEKICWLR